MPRVTESCAGNPADIPDETEITQSFEPAPPPGPPPPPPPGLFADVGPWLATLGILVVAALLVWLFVFRGHGHPHTVPAVVGMQQQQAVARLNRAGYDVTVVIGAASKPRGIVVTQIPGAGSRLPRGGRVTLHVSNGQPVQVTTTSGTTTTAPTTTAGTTTTAATTAAVPNVVGQDMAAGAGQVEAAGFVAETDPATASQTAGQIVAETPAAGTQAAAGSTVALQVAVGSSRPAVQVPNVLGQKAAAARAALLQAKLTVRTQYKKVAKKDVGVVVAQAPGGGGSAPAYSQVTLTVGQ
jgi:serine/threonine-protein kinase